MNDFETYVPIRASDLSWEEEKKAFGSLIFVTTKRKEGINACKVVNKSKQHTYNEYDKADGSISIVVTESVCMTRVIDARERREVAALEIVNAFL